jgi:Fur family iron response transcriptional regulator
MSTEFDHSRKNTIERLKQAGVTPTQQRVEIAQIMFARPQHLSAEQVLSMVNAENAVVSKATVYNTLGLFASKGLINEVIVDPTKVFYDSNTSSHHHFYNVDTGELTDVASDSVNLENLPPLPEGTRAEAIDVIIRLRQHD